MSATTARRMARVEASSTAFYEADFAALVERHPKRWAEFDGNEAGFVVWCWLHSDLDLFDELEPSCDEPGAYVTTPEPRERV